MPQKIRLWAVADNEVPKKVGASPIGLEKRLHDWLEKDISILDEKLLVIGREVEAHDRNRIDLLCIDADGTLVIVEIKRSQTPRDVVAQALDYASWVKDLTPDRVKKIADEYLKSDGPLEAALAAKFDEQPETLNESHRSLIVAEGISAGTERIVHYLSELGVPINVATVQAFRDEREQEMLAQVFLVEPDVARVRDSLRKRPNLKVSEVEELAKRNGLSHLYQPLQKLKVLKRVVMGEKMSYFWRDREKQKTMILVDVANPDNGGLGFEVHATRFNDHLNVSPGDLKTMLPTSTQEVPASWRNSLPDDKLLKGAFRKPEEVCTFVAKVTEAVERLEAN